MSRHPAARASVPVSALGRTHPKGDGFVTRMCRNSEWKEGCLRAQIPQQPLLGALSSPTNKVTSANKLTPAAGLGQLLCILECLCLHCQDPGSHREGSAAHSPCLGGGSPGVSDPEGSRTGLPALPCGVGVLVPRGAAHGPSCRLRAVPCHPGSRTVSRAPVWSSQGLPGLKPTMGPPARSCPPPARDPPRKLRAPARSSQASGTSAGPPSSRTLRLGAPAFAVTLPWLPPSRPRSGSGALLSQLLWFESRTG